MTNAHIAVLQVASTMVLVGFSSYVGGRVHQWRRQDDERSTAFREGFLRASSTLVALFSSAQQTAAPTRPPGRSRPGGESGPNPRPDPASAGTRIGDGERVVRPREPGRTTLFICPR